MSEVQTEIVSLQANDIVVVRTDMQLKLEQSLAIEADVLAKLPAGCRVLVLGWGFDLQILRTEMVEADRITNSGPDLNPA